MSTEREATSPHDTAEGPGAELTRGRTLGDFVVGEKLEQGGFGAVYSAQQTLLGREAVIKVLHPALRESSRQRFLREARLASKLDHPFAAHVYAFGVEQDGLLWIAMERVRGTPLNQLLKTQGQLTLHRFIPFFEKLCEVVQTAHAQGIVHRDLKPANVMVLSRAGKLLPKLLDLGIAKLREDLDGVSPEMLSAAAEMPESGGSSGSTPVPNETYSTTRAHTMAQRTQTLAALDNAVSMDLTQAAQVMGSPHYMAPEQWVNPASADARTDIYALGVLAYQCLTGRLPFEGKTVRTIAAGHARQPFPHLPQSFPSEMDEVLAKAAAKRPADRFESAMELAQALRASSRLTEEEVVVPQLAEDVRELFISDSPQPLAETVALMEAARRPQRAVLAAMDILRVVSRYIGVLALASRARVGPGAASDTPSALAAIEKLRGGTLSDAGWWNLARDLVLPFRDRRDAHPVPELIELFVDPDGADEPSADAQLRELWQTLELARREDSAAAAAMPDIVKRLGAFLKRLFFLHEYRLRLRRGETSEHWFGLRRAVRLTSASGDLADVGDGAFYLAGRDGTPVLSLSPILQPIAPTPGAVLEPFFLDGNGRHGAKLVALPVGFERHDETLWKWFSEHVVDVGEAADSEGGDWAPYLGLASFTAAQSGNFFGREKEAEAFANRLRIQALLGIVGPSGAGKSSFLQAGVLPLLPGWESVTVRPGPSPFTALLQKLAQEKVLPAGLTVATAKEALVARPEVLGEWLLAEATNRGRTLLLVVDQFEELVTLCTDVEEREAFARALVEAARSPERPVRVVLAFRDDFLIRLQQLTPFRERLGEGLQLLGTPAPQDLMRILTKPAERAQYAFEDDELPKQIVKEVAALPGALALLSFTASKLWELRDRQLKRMTRRAYQALGGVGGALAHHAESTLSAMPEKDKPLVREAFRHLVTAEGTRAVLSRVELDQLLGGAAMAEPLLERLIVARLLVTSETGAAEDRVEVIHEALLASWPRLVQWQREDAENLRMRDALRAAARQWAERGKPKGLLWRGEPLLEYKVWRGRYTGAVTELEGGFAQASLREEARGRNLRRGLLLTTFVGLLVVLAIVLRAQRQASQSAAQAKSRLAELREEQGRLASLGDKPLEALVYLESAYREGIRGPGIQYLLGRSRDVAAASRYSVAAHDGYIVSLAVSPDEKRALTGSADRTAALWQVENGKRLAVLEGHRDAVMDVAFTPDGATALTASRDGTLHLWNAEDGKTIGALKATSHIAYDLDVSPDGRFAALARDDNQLEVWDLKARSLATTVTGPIKMTQARFSPDGKWLAGTVGPIYFGTTEPGDVPLWSLDGWKLRVLKGHQRPVRVIAFSPDGKTAATGAEDNNVILWEASTGRALATLSGHTNHVVGLAFSPDGRLLVSGSTDSSARVWDVEGHKLVATLAGHSQNVPLVRFTPDGERVVTGSEDGTARLWDARSGDFVWSFVGHVEAVSALWSSRAGDVLLTTGRDGMMKAWRLDQRRFVRAVPAQTPSAGFLLSPDGAITLLVKQDFSGLEEWALSARERRASFTFPAGMRGFGWAPRSDLLATSASTGIQLWQLPGGKEVWTRPTAPDDPKDFGNVDLNLDGTRLAISHSSATRVELWDVPGRRKVATLSSPGGAISTVYFSGVGNPSLLTGTTDGLVTSWRAEDGKLEWTGKTQVTALYAVTSSPDGRFVAAGGTDLTVTVWDARTHLKVASLHGLQGTINGISFNRDGSLVMAAGTSPRYSIWETRTWKQVGDVPTGLPVQSGLFLPDGRLVTQLTDGYLAVWDTRLRDFPQGELERFTRCTAPYRLEGEHLVRWLQTESGCAGTQ